MTSKKSKSVHSTDILKVESNVKGRILWNVDILQITENTKYRVLNRRIVIIYLTNLWPKYVQIRQYSYIA